MGAVAGPFDCFLTHRGLKTLGVRMDRHCDNAEKVVDFLTSHAAVSEVIYPGLESAPRPRGRGQADEALRRDGVLPGRRRHRAGPAGLRVRRGLHPRGVARRRRVAHRAPREDDARQRRRHRPRGARRPGPPQRGHRDGRRPAGRPRPCRSAEAWPPSSASTSAPPSPRRRWSTSSGRHRRRRQPPDHAAGRRRGRRRPRRVRRVPGRRWSPRTPAPRTPRCWPAPAPAAGCASPWSATRSSSPRRRAAGSRCPAAARSSRSGRSAATTTCRTSTNPTWCC